MRDAQLYHCDVCLSGFRFLRVERRVRLRTCFRILSRRVPLTARHSPKRPWPPRCPRPCFPKLRAGETVSRDSSALENLASVQDAQPDEESFVITLTSARESDAPAVDSRAAQADYVSTITAEPVRTDTSYSAIEAALQEAVSQTAFVQVEDQEEVFSLETYSAASGANVFVTPTAGGDDIRRVTGSRANMRSGPGTEFLALGSLTEGTQVSVLEEPGNGWIMLEVIATGETGWMADWLVAAAND